MRRKLFDKTLDFEINLIGYKDQGESIVFFIKADGKAVYAGLVDCYEEQSDYAAFNILKDEKINYLDFVCWTHPHEDHTIGMDRILESFCNERTLCWIPPFVKNDIEKCSLSVRKVYRDLFHILESKKKKKMKIRTAADAQVLEKFECCGNSSINPYLFEIRSFAPDSYLLNELKVQERFSKGNIYSIGLIVNVGQFYAIFAGDVENRTIKCIPDYYFDIKERVDYIKIPHHGSSSASYFVDRLQGLQIASPSVAATTVYHTCGLPNREVLRRYAMWGKDTEVYSAGSIGDRESGREAHGIVRTTVDILEKREAVIETFLFGNAACVTDIVS